MNPFIQATLGHVEAGKQIGRITMDKRHEPSKVIFEFVDGTTAETPVQCDHQTFIEWWKRTGMYIRLLHLIKPLEELE
jgi:hypothetical protein